MCDDCPPTERELEKARRMNMLPAPRVGWQERLSYQHWLAELASNGYLTTEEYEARNEWLSNARTKPELEAVFADLPRMQSACILSPQYTATRPTEKTRRYIGYLDDDRRLAKVIVMWASSLGFLLLNILIWNPVGIGLFVVFSLIWAGILIKRIIR